ncbi:MAG TPA: alpha/beta hydrolase [Tahibacter sp.]|nr:alpha/beta hydrolase [Tahibacter sp.]
MSRLARQRIQLSGGTDLAYVAAGDSSDIAVLLLHGIPSSADVFRGVVDALAKVVYVVAPDLPGAGESEPLRDTTFAAYADAVGELLAHLRVGPRYVYLHDFGAPVGFHLAMREPDLVRGLIVQNANAHRTGFSAQWDPVEAYWANPTAQNEAAVTQHLSAQGTRDQYYKGVPDDVAAKIDPRMWEEDWRVMSMPGRLDAQRAMLRDYGRYVARFGELKAWLDAHQPPALMVWGRHDIYFDIAETVSWMRDLPRMECHVLDAGHLLLETHAQEAAKLMMAFVERTSRR